MNVKILVVTYNTQIINAPVLFEALRNGLSPSDILIGDNSTNVECKIANQEVCESKGIIYLDNQGNVGLSKAYNAAIAFLEHVDYDALILFDQDTEVPKDYFNIVRNSLMKYPDVLIHAPYVESPYVYISPKQYDRHKIVHWIAKNQEPQYNLACINSGLVLRKELFSRVGKYDETLFLDFVDYEFFRRIMKYNLPIKVLDVHLNQHFSGDQYSNREGDFHRYAIYVKDLRQYRRIHHIPYRYIEFFLLLRCGALTKHYRSLRPAFMYINVLQKGRKKK